MKASWFLLSVFVAGINSNAMAQASDGSNDGLVQLARTTAAEAAGGVARFQFELPIDGRPVALQAIVDTGCTKIAKGDEITLSNASGSAKAFHFWGPVRVLRYQFKTSGGKEVHRPLGVMEVITFLGGNFAGANDIRILPQPFVVTDGVMVDVQTGLGSDICAPKFQGKFKQVELQKSLFALFRQDVFIEGVYIGSFIVEHRVSSVELWPIVLCPRPSSLNTMVAAR